MENSLTDPVITESFEKRATGTKFVRAKICPDPCKRGLRVQNPFRLLLMSGRYVLRRKKMSEVKTVEIFKRPNYLHYSKKF